MMLKTLLQFEWRHLKADPTLWILAAIFFAAAAYGIGNGKRWVAFQTDAILHAHQDDDLRLENARILAAELDEGVTTVYSFRDPRNPNSASRYILPRHAVKPPSSLASLATGQSDLYPYFFQISMDSKERVIASTELENPLRMLVGRFDLAFVIIYLWPLLVIILTYDFVSKERERGTLSLLLSQPASLGRLVGVKAAARAGFLLLLIFILGLGVAFFGGIDWSQSGALARLALWFAVIVAYTGFWFGMVLLVKSMGWNSATNALSLSASWLMFVVLLPSSLNLLLKSAYPLPSRVEFISAMRDASDEVSAQGSEMLAQYYEDHPDLVPGSGEIDLANFSARRIAVNQEIEIRVEPVLQKFNAQLEKQQHALERFKYLSPAILTQSAFNDLSGTGDLRHRHFLGLVEDYHNQWRGFFGGMILRRETFSDFDQTPRFHYKEEPSSPVFRSAGLSLLGMMIPAAFLGWLGMRRFKKYPLTG